MRYRRDRWIAVSRRGRCWIPKTFIAGLAGLTRCCDGISTKKMLQKRCFFVSFWFHEHGKGVECTWFGSKWHFGSLNTSIFAWFMIYLWTYWFVLFLMQSRRKEDNKFFLVCVDIKNNIRHVFLMYLSEFLPSMVVQSPTISHRSTNSSWIPFFYSSKHQLSQSRTKAYSTRKSEDRVPCFLSDRVETQD